MRKSSFSAGNGVTYVSKWADADFAQKYERAERIGSTVILGIVLVATLVAVAMVLTDFPVPFAWAALAVIAVMYGCFYAKCIRAEKKGGGNHA